MNTRLIHYAAALLASAAATLAAAQPANTPFADEAIASAAKGDQGGQAVNAVVQALNAEASLKNAKITVAEDGEVLLLTGAAKTQDQVKKASEIAAASASGAKVVNVIQPDHMTYNVPPQEPQRAG